MKYHLVTLACLLMAVACYGLFALGGAAIAFLAAGLVLEAWVWIRLFRRPKQRGA